MIDLLAQNPTPTPTKMCWKKIGSLGLTRRETEVLTWIAQGKTNYEIGVIFSAATSTICKHVERILFKLSVENRTAAAVVALASTTIGPRRSASDEIPRVKSLGD